MSLQSISNGTIDLPNFTHSRVLLSDANLNVVTAAEGVQSPQLTYEGPDDIFAQGFFDDYRSDYFKGQSLYTLEQNRRQPKDSVETPYSVTLAMPLGFVATHELATNGGSIYLTSIVAHDLNARAGYEGDLVAKDVCAAGAYFSSLLGNITVEGARFAKSTDLTSYKGDITLKDSSAPFWTWQTEGQFTQSNVAGVSRQIFSRVK